MMRRKSTYDNHACKECGNNGVDKHGTTRYQWFRVDHHKLQCPTCGDFRDDGWDNPEYYLYGVSFCAGTLWVRRLMARNYVNWPVTQE